MTRADVQSNKRQKGIVRLLIAAVMFLSVVLTLATALFGARPVTASDVKKSGDNWTAYAQQKAAAAKYTDGYYVKLSTLLNQLVFNGGNSYNRGIIDNLLDENGAEIPGTALYTNDPYNYCFTLSTAQELMAFSYMCSGMLYSSLGDDAVSNNTVAAFFRNANIALGNNIDYLGLHKYYTDDSGSNFIRIDNADTYYTSPQAYYGYAADSLRVPQAFLPISLFTGNFEGNGFEIYNLRIARNATHQSITRTNIDAMFASIASGGTVRNFGLIAPEFISVADTPYAPADPADYFPAGSIAGNNAGSAEKVFCINAKLSTNTTESAANFQDSLPTVYSGSPAQSSYTLGTVINGTVTDGGAADINAADFAGWYFGDDRTVRAVDHSGKIVSANFPRLSGLRRDKTTVTEKYAILTGADLIAFNRIFFEGFDTETIVTVGDSASAVVDCRFVADDAWLPAARIGDAPPQKVTLTSPVESTDFSTRSVIQNLTVSAQMIRGINVSTGLFMFDDANTVVTNLNFISCTVQMRTAVSTAQIAHVGLIAARIAAAGTEISHIGSHSLVGIADDLVVGIGTRVGGIVGSTMNVAVNINNVMLSGTTDSGSLHYHHYGSNTDAESNSYYTTGGLAGRSLATSGNMRLNNIYIGGKVTGLSPRTKAATSNNSMFAYMVTGGLMGYGAFPNSANFGGIYIDAEVASVNDDDTFESLATSGSGVMYLGGVMGDVTAGNAALSADKLIFGGKIKITSQLGLASNTMSHRAFIGGFAGRSRRATFSSVVMSDTDAKSFFTGGFYEKITDNTPRITLTVGNFAGTADNTTLTGAVNEKALNVTRRYSGVAAGGFFGSATGTNKGLTNKGDVAVTQLSNYSVSVGGIAADGGSGSYTECKNSGNLSVTAGDIYALGGSGAVQSNVRINGIGNTASATDCVNSGNITVTGRYAANYNNSVTTIINGIVASGAASGCVNSGDLTLDVDTNRLTTINGISGGGARTDCANTGTLTTKNAGIAGTPSFILVSGMGENGNSENCYNGGTVIVSGAAITWEISGLNNKGAAINCTNNANIELSGYTGTMRLAGVVLQSNATGCINNGNLTVTGGAAVVGGIALGMGGAGATRSVRDSVNNGSVTVTSTAEVFAGGIAAYVSAAATYNIGNCVNGGSVKVTANGVSSAGGIAAHVSSATAANFNDCFNLAAVEVSGNAQSAAAGIAARYAGSGIVSIGDSVNDTAATITSSGYAGAIIGAADSGRVSVRSVLGYGEVSAAVCAGGVLGYSSTSVSDVTVTAAAVYKTVSATGGSGIAGGVAGRVDNLAVIDQTAVYGAVEGATAGATAGSVANGTYSACISVGESGTFAVGNLSPEGTFHTTYSAGGAAAAADVMHGDTMPLHYTNEYGYFKNADSVNGKYGANTASSSLAWSELPYDTTRSLFTGKNLYAVTTASGRRAGRYVGGNADMTGLETAFAKAIALIAKHAPDSAAAVQSRAEALKAQLAAQQQITESRDNFLTDFTYADGAYTFDGAALIDGDKSGANADLPLASLEFDEEKNKVNKYGLTSLIMKSSPYYTLNSVNAEFKLAGGSIALKDGSALFTPGSTVEVLGYDLTREIDFKTNTESLVTALVMRVGVYRGTKQDTDEWKQKYMAEYTFTVLYYDSTPGVTLGEFKLTSASAPTADNVHVTSEQTLAGTGDAVQDETKDAAVHNAVDASGNFVKVPWVYGELQASYNTVEIDEGALAQSNFSFGMFSVTDGVETAVSYSGYVTPAVTTQNFTTQSITAPGGVVISVPVGTLVLSLTVTDRNTLTELAAGKYRFEFSVDIAGIAFSRSFVFEKALSGDTYLHFQNGNLIKGAGMRPQMVTLKSPDSTSYHSNSGMAGFSNSMNTFTSMTDEKTRELRVTAALNNTNMFGVLPAFDLISKYENTEIGGIKLNALAWFYYSSANYVIPSRFAQSVSKPAVTLREVRDTGKTPSHRYYFDYEFTVTAEDGSTCKYIYTVQYTADLTFGATLSDITGGTSTPLGSRDVLVGRTAAGTYRSSHTYTTSALSTSFALGYAELWYSPDGTTEAVYAGTATASEPLGSRTAGGITYPALSVSGNTFTLDVSADTSGGKYTVKPYHSYASNAYTAGNAPQGITAMPNYVSIADAAGNPLTHAAIDAHYSSAHDLTVTKDARRNSLIKDVAYTQNVPLSVMTGFYNLLDNGTMHSLASPAFSGGNMSIHYGTGSASENIYLDPDSDGYLADRVADTYLINNIFGETFEGEVSISMRLFFKGSQTYAEGEREYNDEFVEVYLLAQTDGKWGLAADAQPLAKQYVTENGVVQYAYVDLFVPDGTPMAIRVVAENPAYYTDYMLQTDVPVRNKTVVLNITDPVGYNDGFVVSLRKGSRPINLLFAAHSAPTAETFNTTRLSAGDFALSLTAFSPGFSIVITSVTVAPGFESYAAEVSKLSDTTFRINVREAITVIVEATVVYDSTVVPPWGDIVYG